MSHNTYYAAFSGNSTAGKSAIAIAVEIPDELRMFVFSLRNVLWLELHPELKQKARSRRESPILLSQYLAWKPVIHSKSNLQMGLQ